MNGRERTPGETLRQASKERDSKKLLARIQNFRPRICYVLSLLRIHSSDCEHCMVRQTCGDELRKRLEELDGRKQPSSQENGNHREIR
jgi:negative regulator of sigma E activity